MWYRGVQIIYIDSLNQYQFIYDGCPKDYLKGNHGEPLYIKDIILFFSWSLKLVLVVAILLLVVAS